VSDTLHIDDPRDGRAIRIVKRARIGVDYAGRHWSRRLLRFYIAGNPFVSRK
jgi:DNA-3-methyladenine glycosylase